MREYIFIRALEHNVVITVAMLSTYQKDDIHFHQVSFRAN